MLQVDLLVLVDLSIPARLDNGVKRVIVYFYRPSLKSPLLSQGLQQR